MMYIIGSEYIDNDSMHTTVNYPLYRLDSISIQRVRFHSYVSPRQTLYNRDNRWWESGYNDLGFNVFLPSNVEPWMDVCCECEYYEMCDGQMCLFAE